MTNVSAQSNPFNCTPEITAWFNDSNSPRRLSIQTNQLSLQVKKDKSNKLVIVLVEINKALRGNGYFGQFIKELQLTAQIVVELPQPRLASYCERLNIEVILDEPNDWLF